MVAHFDDSILELWYKALHSPCGIAVSVTDFNQAKGKFYAARAKAMDLTLNIVSICQSPTNPNHLWLVKREA